MKSPCFPWFEPKDIPVAILQRAIFYHAVKINLVKSLNAFQRFKKGGAKTLSSGFCGAWNRRSINVFNGIGQQTKRMPVLLPCREITGELNVINGNSRCFRRIKQRHLIYTKAQRAIPFAKRAVIQSVASPVCAPFSRFFCDSLIVKINPFAHSIFGGKSRWPIGAIYSKRESNHSDDGNENRYHHQHN